MCGRGRERQHERRDKPLFFPIFSRKRDEGIRDRQKMTQIKKEKEAQGEI